jgi:hypothetical protein
VWLARSYLSRSQEIPGHQSEEVTMKKAIDLQAKVKIPGAGGNANAAQQALENAFAQANPRLKLTVKAVAPPDPTGVAVVRAYIEGDQPAPDDFQALALAALQKAVATAGGQAIGQPGAGGAPGPATSASLAGVNELVNVDENEGLVLPPPPAPAGPGGPGVAAPGPRPGPGPAPAAPAANVADVAAMEGHPVPPQNNYIGCPSTGDGGDGQTNIRKNRLDSTAWTLVTISSIINLPFPAAIGRQQRVNWSAANTAAIAKFEGIPIQVEGWLAAAKQEGPESCNCHSPLRVDFHMWVVDDPSKVHDRTQSVVCEMSPRVRTQHPSFSFARISPLVDGVTRVRISGWLMMDQEHPDQIGKTRGTIWEIHPIVGLETFKGGKWVSL